MKYNPEIHHRKSIRLKDYDYSSEGLYFITICAYQMEHLFGKIIDGKMILNDIGFIIEKEINKTNIIRNNVKIDKYVIMPNHIHFIMEILEKGFSSGKPLQTIKSDKNVGCLPVANPNKLRPNTVSSIVNQIKSKITKEVRKNTNIYAIWQRNYYENIIRNEKVYIKILEYIEQNGMKTDTDKSGEIGVKMVEYKYFRIHSDDVAYLTQMPRGLFVAIWRLVDAKIMNESEIAEYYEIRSWFEKMLPIPPFYSDGNSVKGITWYKNNEYGLAMLSSMKFYLGMAEKYSLKLYITKTKIVPGNLIYEDDFQIGVSEPRHKGFEFSTSEFVNDKR